MFRAFSVKKVYAAITTYTDRFKFYPMEIHLQ